MKTNNEIFTVIDIDGSVNGWYFDTIADFNINKYDLSFFWKDNIDIIYVNKNYLGTNINSVINYYNYFLTNEI